MIPSILLTLQPKTLSSSMGEEFEDLPSSSTSPPPPPPPPPDTAEQSAIPPPPPSATTEQSPPSDKDPSPPPTPPFDPTRMIGIIRRKALIKDLAAVYHAECLSYCQQLLQHQKQTEEPFADFKHLEDGRKVPMRPPKRSKKVR